MPFVTQMGKELEFHRGVKGGFNTGMSTSEKSSEKANIRLLKTRQPKRGKQRRNVMFFKRLQGPRQMPTI